MHHEYICGFYHQKHCKFYNDVLPTFMVEGNAMLQFKVGENKDVIFSHSCSETLLILALDLLGEGSGTPGF